MHLHYLVNDADIYAPRYSRSTDLKANISSTIPRHYQTQRVVTWAARTPAINPVTIRLNGFSGVVTL